MIDYCFSLKVVCCASLPDCRLLFVACKSGVILAYRTKYSQEKVWTKVWVMLGKQSS